MKKVPTLTPTGWVSAVNERADRLIAYYLTSEASQSHLYEGQITSLPSHVQQYGSDAMRLRSAVESSLNRYLRRYFSVAEVRVDTEIPDPDDPERINLRLDITVIDEGKRYSLGKLIATQNSKVLNIFDLNNH